MSGHKPFASLSPTLLARKGTAKPAMRPQLQPMRSFQQAAARQLDEDLGWNDMGHDDDVGPVAEVVPIVSAAPVPEGTVPEVVRQQHAIADHIVEPAALRRQATNDEVRRSALADGRRAAFTLRLDAARHLDLRLACTLSNRSAQQIVTEALDRLIAEMPDVAALSAQLRQRARKAPRGDCK